MPLKNTAWMQLAHELQPSSLRSSRKAELTALKSSRNHSPHSKGSPHTPKGSSLQIQMLLLHLAALQCTCHPPKRQDHSPERKKETTYPIPRTNTPPHSQVKEAASRSKYLPALKYAQGSLLRKRESSSTMEEKKKKKKITHSITKEQGILQRKHSPGSDAAPTLPSP